MEKITIYTSKTCDYCQQMKNEFEKEKIQFEEKLTEDYKEDCQEIVNLTKITKNPTIEYKNKCFIAGRDYMNTKKLKEILKIFKNSKYNDTKIII